MKCYIKDYPRPQFVRGNWESLNGSWDFGFDDADVGEQEKWFEQFHGSLSIQVPFTYETRLSGIQDETRHDHIWYHRTVAVDGSRLSANNYVLHFEGSDFVTKVWINGQFAGSHRGGYARFSLDITNLVQDGENHITVKVDDSFDRDQPRGKQRWADHSFGCWYVQTTGIWKTVWTEYVPKVSLDHVKMTPNLCDNTVSVAYDVRTPAGFPEEELMVEAVVTFRGDAVTRNVACVKDGHACARLNLTNQGIDDCHWAVKKWSPSAPNLYDVEFRVLDRGVVCDTVGSYFGMREIRIQGDQILLNDRPLYQRLILDQGYWQDSHLTPPSEEALVEDIDKIMAMGYNGLRKHQKIEDERFLYWCDVKGMLVWSEAPAAYGFSDYAVAEFTREWMEIVQQNYNHPSIITWTPFNESWGIHKVCTDRCQQSFTESIYYLTKAMDPMRPVIVNDGWEHTISDIITLHDYEESGEAFKERYTQYKDQILGGKIAFGPNWLAFANGFQYRGQPVIISEFGGIAFNNDDSGWGYGNKVNTKEAFVDRFDKITTAIKELPYVCGYCYTQVSDVQQEINGLMDMDRNFKVEPETIRQINLRKVGCLTR